MSLKVAPKIGILLMNSNKPERRRSNKKLFGGQKVLYCKLRRNLIFILRLSLKELCYMVPDNVGKWSICVSTATS